MERAVKDVQGFVNRLEHDRKVTLDAVQNLTPNVSRIDASRDLASSDSLTLQEAT